MVYKEMDVQGVVANACLGVMLARAQVYVEGQRQGRLCQGRLPEKGGIDGVGLASIPFGNAHLAGSRFTQGYNNGGVFLGCLCDLVP